MTPEEIKKIAEEYADSTLNEYSNGVDKDNAKSLISDLKQFITFLTTRFYLVEKSKVEEMYPHYDNFNTFNRGVCYCLRILFGSDIRKEEEE